jgi:hypothetical protein
LLQLQLPRVHALLAFQSGGNETANPTKTTSINADRKEGRTIPRSLARQEDLRISRLQILQTRPRKVDGDVVLVGQRYAHVGHLGVLLDDALGHLVERGLDAGALVVHERVEEDVACAGGDCVEGDGVFDVLGLCRREGDRVYVNDSSVVSEGIYKGSWLPPFIRTGAVDRSAEDAVVHLRQGRKLVPHEALKRAPRALEDQQVLQSALELGRRLSRSGIPLDDSGNCALVFPVADERVGVWLGGG